MEEMLNNADYVAKTLECLRACAYNGSYEAMNEEALLDQIKVQVTRLESVLKSDAEDGQTKHSAYCRLASVAYIMAMRLDHVDKVYE